MVYSTDGHWVIVIVDVVIDIVIEPSIVSHS